MVKSGVLALSEITIINPPTPVTYAVESRYASGFQSINELFDSLNQIELELWKYDPLIFKSDDCVDPLSLSMSLSDMADERVELMIEEMLNKLWEDIDGSRI